MKLHLYLHDPITFCISLVTEFFYNDTRMGFVYGVKFILLFMMMFLYKMHNWLQIVRIVSEEVWERIKWELLTEDSRGVKVRRVYIINSLQ